MKKSLFLIIGSFALVLFLCTLLNWFYNHHLHEEHKKLVAIDQLTTSVHAHYEWLNATILDLSNYDSIAQNDLVFQQVSKKHFAKLQSEIQTTFQDRSEVRSRIIQITKELERQEFSLFVIASRIGFKEAGFMGEMRNVIHRIESDYPEYKSEILSLRRHEKDFIMRLDNHYAELLNKEALQFQGNKTCKAYLANYLSKFDSVRVNLLKLKSSDHKNAQMKWAESNDNLMNYLRAFRGNSIQQSYSITYRSEMIQLLVSSISLILLLLISFLIANRITKQVSYLQNQMFQFINSGYNSNELTDKQLPRNEIGVISSHFIRMARKIKSDMHVLEDRVQRRTNSLIEQNKILANNQKSTEESMRYARDLQHSLLVPISKIEEEFDEVYIHYSPKALVGGDFYWMKTYKESGHDKILFALADCTGHGVPGALLSVMGMNLLDELFAQGIRNPHTLLKSLRTSLLRRFGQNTDQRMDGMDVAMISIDRKTNELLFSGAHLPIWIIRKNQLIELKGDRVSVGFTYSNHDDFDLHHVQLEKNDRILLYTDGIVDQFGGSMHKKMGKKNLRNLLHRCGEMNTENLFETLVQFNKSWQGNLPQTDDSTVILIEPHMCQNEQENQAFSAAIEDQNETKKVEYQLGA